MSDASQFAEYDRWIGRKRTALRRPKLDCGHANRGEVFFHALCDRLSCSTECANGPHDCGEYAGVRSGTEEEAPEPLEAVSPALLVQCDTSPWVSFADVAAGPSVGGNPETVDIRRAVQDGIAPPPGIDRVHDACRAEVIRQGLSEYWLDGLRYVVEQEESQVEALRPFFGPALEAEAAAVAVRVRHIAEEIVAREIADQPEPSAPLVDASSDTAPDEPRPKFRFPNLAAALRARARRGGTDAA